MPLHAGFSRFRTLNGVLLLGTDVPPGRLERGANQTAR
jgi:hypothetical protein